MQRACAFCAVFFVVAAAYICPADAQFSRRINGVYIDASNPASQLIVEAVPWNTGESITIIHDGREISAFRPNAGSPFVFNEGGCIVSFLPYNQGSNEGLTITRQGTCTRSNAALATLGTSFVKTPPQNQARKRRHGIPGEFGAVVNQFLNIPGLRRPGQPVPPPQQTPPAQPGQFTQPGNVLPVDAPAQNTLPPNQQAQMHSPPPAVQSGGAPAGFPGTGQNVSPQGQPAVATASSQPSFETAPAPDYMTMMRLYMAANGDLLSTLPLAWEYYLITNIAPDPSNRLSQQCFALGNEIESEFNRDKYHQLARTNLQGALTHAKTWNKTGIFKLRTTVRLKDYDNAKGQFSFAPPIEPRLLGGIVFVNRDKAFCHLPVTGRLLPPKNPITGYEVLPEQEAFRISIDKEDRVSALPMSREQAEALLAARTAKSGYLRNRDVMLEVLIETRPATFERTHPGLMGAHIIAARLVDQERNNIVLHTFSLPPVDRAVADGSETSLAHPDAAVLTPLRTSLLLLRDHPDVVPQPTWLNIARDQIVDEQSCYRELEKARTNPNAPRPMIFSIEALKGQRPDFVAGPIKDAFRSPGADWEFAKKEPGFDPRLEIVYDAFMFSEQQVKDREPGFIAQELWPTFKTHSLDMARAVPTTLQIVSPLAAVSYDFQAKSFRFKGAQDGTYRPDADLLEPAKLDSFPEAAQYPFVYDSESAKYITKEPYRKPGPNLNCNASDRWSPTSRWRSLIAGLSSYSYGAGVVVPALSLDRRLTLKQIPVPPAQAEAITAQLTQRKIALRSRVVIHVDKTFLSKGRQGRDRAAGILVATVQSVEIVDDKNTVIASLPVTAFPTAKDLATAKAADLDGAGRNISVALSQPAMFGPEIADLLVLKNVPAMATTKFLGAMLFARWQYEHTSRNPQYGRFFTPTQLSGLGPDADLLQKFVEWSKSRAAALPSTFIIRHTAHYASGNVSLGDCIATSFADAMGGTDAINRRNSDVASCKRGGGSDRQCERLGRAPPTRVFDLNLNKCDGTDLGYVSPLRGNRIDFIKGLPQLSGKQNWRGGGAASFNVVHEIGVTLTGVDQRGGGAQFKVEANEVRFIDPASNARLAVLGPIPPEQDDQPEIKDWLNVSPLPKKAGPDVVGLQLGMTFDEAEKIIRSSMEVGLELISTGKSDGTGNFSDYARGRLYISKDQTQSIAILDANNTVDNVVFAVIRQVRLQKGQVQAAAIHDGLRNKYGAENYITGSSKQPIWVWGEKPKNNTQGCFPVQTNSRMGWLDWRRADGKPFETPLIGPKAYPPTLVITDSWGNTRENCSGTLAATLSSEPEGWDEFDTWLFDVGAYRNAGYIVNQQEKQKKVQKIGLPKTGIKF